MFNGFADIIFFAVVAVFFIARLYTTLGRKDFEGDDRTKINLDEKGKVIRFPGEAGQTKALDLEIEDFIEEKNQDLEKYGKVLMAKILEMRRYDPSFAADSFLKGASQAFEMVIEAFATGDKRTLKELLSKDVYQGFIGEIEKREKEGKTRETTLVAIVSASIKDIVLNKKYARIAVEFVSEQVNLVKDKTGKVIEGSPSDVEEIRDVWTFARNLTSSNPNWELVETQ